MKNVHFFPVFNFLKLLLRFHKYTKTEYYQCIKENTNRNIKKFKTKQKLKKTKVFVQTRLLRLFIIIAHTCNTHFFPNKPDKCILCLFFYYFILILFIQKILKIRLNMTKRIFYFYVKMTCDAKKITVTRTINAKFFTFDEEFVKNSFKSYFLYSSKHRKHHYLSEPRQQVLFLYLKVFLYFFTIYMTSAN